MRLAPLLLLLLLSTTGNGQSLKLDGVTTLHITRNSTSIGLPVTARVHHVFPAYDVSEVIDSLPPKQTQVWLRCPVRVAQDGYLSIGDDEVEVFMIPGDTIHVNVLGMNVLPLRDRYTFKGRTQAIQDYYLAKKEQFPVDPGQLSLNAGGSAPNLVIFKQQIDSLTRVEMEFWQQYRAKHPLPDWFVRHESDAIRYNDAMLRVYMSWYQPDYQKKEQTLPPGYFDFLEKLPVQNLQAQYSYAYVNFLREYVGRKLKLSGASNPAEFETVLTKTINEELGSDLGSFFRLWEISSGAKNNPEVARTELAAHSFPAKYQYLVSYLNSRSSQQLTVLKPGNKAPAFFLPDSRDSLVSLSQFNGKVVYLCFWFAGCGGCQIEFPHENRLVEQFSGQPVEIVSICTHTQPDKWREASQKAGLKTTNLLANKAWEETLETKYAISTYPHYVLIDAEGRVLENFATRPSQNAAANIRQAVSGLKPK